MKGDLKMKSRILLLVLVLFLGLVFISPVLADLYTARDQEGNIIGGSLCVATIYWLVYLRKSEKLRKG